MPHLCLPVLLVDTWTGCSYPMSLLVTSYHRRFLVAHKPVFQACFLELAQSLLDSRKIWVHIFSDITLLELRQTHPFVRSLLSQPQRSSSPERLLAPSGSGIPIIRRPLLTRPGLRFGGWGGLINLCSVTYQQVTFFLLLTSQDSSHHHLLGWVISDES